VYERQQVATMSGGGGSIGIGTQVDDGHVQCPLAVDAGSR